MATAALIDAIVRQTTVLLAQLATSGGLRAPLAHIAGQVFLNLTGELEAQGVSRKVSADMFGMALRAYQKKIQRLNESTTWRGRSLWEAVLDYVTSRSLSTRHEVLRRFGNDDEALVKSVLHDLVESGLLSTSGSEAGMLYRATTDEERRLLARTNGGLSELLWALIYREGPIAEATLARQTGVEPDVLAAVLQGLLGEGRIERDGQGRWATDHFCVPRGSRSGWEAAVFDHYHAVVKTLCQRLAQLDEPASAPDVTGGSTYTFVVWPEHPHREEVLQTLSRVRAELGQLRTKVEAHNGTDVVPPRYESVVSYVGQSVTEEHHVDGECSQELQR